MIWLGVALISQLVGQTFALKHYDVSDGLPSMDVYEVMQDSDGFLWFATESGAVRYNGYEFFPTQFGDHLDHSDILGTMEDSQGRIWLRSLGGDASYYHSGEFFFPGNSELCKDLSFSSTILKIFEINDQIYFVSSDNGVHLLKGDSVQKIKTPPLKNACEIPDGILLIGHYGALRIDHLGSQHPFDSIHREKHFATGLFHQSSILLSYGSQITRYNPEMATSAPLFQTSTIQDEVINLTEIDDTTLAVCTRKGIRFFNTSTNLQIGTELTEHAVTSVIQDRKGGLWYTTLGHGIHYNPKPKGRPKRMLKKELPRRVNKLFFDQNAQLWIGSEDNRVVRWDFDEAKVFDLRIDDRTRFDQITSVTEGPDGEIVVLGKLVFSIIRDGKLVRSIYGSGNDLYFGKEGKLWIASVNCYEIKSYGENMVFQGKRPATLRKRTYCLSPYEGSFLAGTESGLYLYDSTEQDFKLIEGTAPFSIADIHLPYILTAGGAILILKQGKAEQVHCNPGLNTKCYSLHSAKDHIYIGTNKGLYRADKSSQSWSIRSFIEGTNVYDLESAGDSLFIGTEEGLLLLDIQANENKLSVPSIFLDSLHVNGNLTTREDISDLSHLESSIRIFFTGLLYERHPTYRYRINKDQWNELNTRELNLKLAPGDYQIEIEALNGNRVRSAPLSFHIHIAEPFWRRSWFILLIILLASTMLGLGLRNYLRKIRKEHHRQRELDLANLKVANIRTRILELEQQALRLQMNPHFLFNSINSIKGLYAQGKVKEAITYIHHFSTFLRVIVNNESPLIPIRTEVEILHHYLNLEKMKFPLVSFKIELGEGIEQDRMQIPFMLVQPFVENAILHGIGPKKAPGTIQVKFQKLGNEMLLIQIIDDGVGLSNRKSTPKKTSMGIKITEERLSMFNSPHPVKVQISNRTDGPGVIVSFQTRFSYE